MQEKKTNNEVTYIDLVGTIMRIMGTTNVVQDLPQPIARDINK